MTRRAWLAWQCLPRGATGAPPNVRELERKHHLANNQLRKLVRGLSKRPSFVELEKMAAALQTSVEWLQFGRGEPPRAHQQPAPWPGPHVPKARPRKTTKAPKRAKHAG